jgi:hypothetical protein
VHSQYKALVTTNPEPDSTESSSSLGLSLRMKITLPSHNQQLAPVFGVKQRRTWLRLGHSLEVRLALAPASSVKTLEKLFTSY